MLLALSMRDVSEIILGIATHGQETGAGEASTETVLKVGAVTALPKLSVNIDACMNASVIVFESI